MNSQAYIGQKIRLPEGIATVRKVYGNIVSTELRDLPKVKRPCGMFYEKRIFQHPPAAGKQRCKHCGELEPDNYQHCPHCGEDNSRETATSPRGTSK